LIAQASKPAQGQPEGQGRQTGAELPYLTALGATWSQPHGPRLEKINLIKKKKTPEQKLSKGS